MFNVATSPQSIGCQTSPGGYTGRILKLSFKQGFPVDARIHRVCRGTAIVTQAVVYGRLLLD
jgi:hypothetical protein